MDNLTIDLPNLQSNEQLVESALRCDSASAFTQLIQGLLALEGQAAQGLTPFHFSLLGQKAWNLGLLNEAVSLLTRSFNLEPKQPVVLQALGVLLIQLGQPSRAKPCLDLALTLDSNISPARLFLGELLISEKHFQAAVDCLEQHLRLDPSSVQCLTNLALALRPLGRLDDAITRAEQALELSQDNSAVHYNLALLLLNNHNWAKGWYHHEWRLSLWGDQGIRLCIPAPKSLPWGGENQAQTRLVMVAEQGLGDTIQFVRYAPYLQQYLAELRLCVPDSLVSLISYSYPGLTVVAASTFSLADDEEWSPFLSAPHHFGIIPDASPIAHP
jgi:tetratricopeptide (TPR) repeat protein